MLGGAEQGRRILRDRPDLLIDPVSIAEAFHYLNCWAHELQLTASTGPVAV